MEVIIDGVRYVPFVAPCENPGLLDFVWDFPDAGGLITIRQYLGALLMTLWDEQDGFSGKRPFGNSCWDIDLICALCGAGAIEAQLNEDGIFDPLPKDAFSEGDLIVRGLIEEMSRSKP